MVTHVQAGHRVLRGDHGSILLDGIDIRVAHLRSLRKQIGIATLIYIGDSDDNYPMSVYDTDSPVGPTGVAPIRLGLGDHAFTVYDALQPYMKNTKIEDCLSASGSLPISPNFSLVIFAAYGTKMELFSQHHNLVEATLSQVEAPSDTVYMTDAAQFQSANGGANVFYLYADKVESAARSLLQLEASA